MQNIFQSALETYIYLGITIALISLISKKSDFFCSVPGLDIAVGLFTLVPWFFSSFFYGLSSLVGCIIGQVAIIYSFSFVHAKMKNYKGPTIKDTLNKIVGPVRNHLGLIISLMAFPLFWTIRFSQIIIYPLLIWTLGFPKYKESDWINVSRQKFSGLVGHDLIWCLYCDWMTGIYSYGAEMLRNVESFWCPIRFYSDKKCDNCKIDFPDIDKWTNADNDLKETTDLLIKKYPPESKDARGWFGYSERGN